MVDQKVISKWKSEIAKLPQPQEGRQQAWTETILKNRLTFKVEKHSPNSGVIRVSLNGEPVSASFWDYNSNGGGSTFKTEKKAWEATKQQLAGLWYMIK